MPPKSCPPTPQAIRSTTTGPANASVPPIEVEETISPLLHRVLHGAGHIREFGPTGNRPESVLV
jgi:hypothetical protein